MSLAMHSISGLAFNWTWFFQDPWTCTDGNSDLTLNCCAKWQILLSKKNVYTDECQAAWRQKLFYSPALMTSVFILWLLLFLALFVFFRATGLGAVIPLLAQRFSSPLVILILPVWSRFKRGEASQRGRSLGLCGGFLHSGRRGSFLLWWVIVSFPATAPVPLPSIALVLHWPEVSTLVLPPSAAMRLLAIGITASPSLPTPVLPGPVVFIVVVMVRAPVTISLPGVVVSPLPATLRLPVPVGAIVRQAIPVRAVSVTVISVVSSVAMTIDIAVSLLTPVPVVSVPVSAPVRVRSVSFQLFHVFGTFETGLGLLLFLNICMPFIPCWQNTGLW